MVNIEKKENLLERYSVLSSIRLFKNIKTELQAFQSNEISLARIKRDYSEKKSISLIKIWLISLNDYVNVSRKLTAGQIEEISIYILQEYYYLNMADIYLVVTNIKKGIYGKHFESMDGTKILSYFEQYADNRVKQVMNVSDSKTIELKQNIGKSERLTKKRESMSIKDIEGKIGVINDIKEAKEKVFKKGN